MRLELSSRSFMHILGERLNNIQPSKSDNDNELLELNPLVSFPSQDRTQTKFMKRIPVLYEGLKSGRCMMLV